MKKLILGMVFVFSTGTIMNANNEKIVVTQDDCLQEAMDFGTFPDDTEDKDYWEWYWTDWYYETFCEN